MLLRKVLIATDFSPPAKRLFECIDELKIMGLEELILVYVINIRLGEGLSTTQQREGEEKLREFEKALKAKGFKVELHTPIGFPASEIASIAKNREVDLILIGSKGKGMMKEAFLGSTTFDVIRLTETPVMIEKYYKNENNEYINVCINKFAKVLIPIDFSLCSRIIIDKAKKLSDVTQEIVLVSIVEEGESQAEIEEIKADYKELLEDIAKEFNKLGISTKIVVEEGIPSQQIVGIAEEEKVTSILMSTRGKGFIKTLLLGSTSDAVARISKRAVILVPCNK